MISRVDVRFARSPFGVDKRNNPLRRAEWPGAAIDGDTLIVWPTGMLQPHASAGQDRVTAWERADCAVAVVFSMPRYSAVLFDPLLLSYATAPISLEVVRGIPIMIQIGTRAFFHLASARDNPSSSLSHRFLHCCRCVARASPTTYPLHVFLN